MLPYIMAHLMTPKKDVLTKMKIQKRDLTPITEVLQKQQTSNKARPLESAGKAI